MLLKKLLGEILSDLGCVTKQHLEEALTEQRKICREKVLPERLQRTRLISETRLAAHTTPSLGQILIDMGAATDKQIDQAIRQQEKMSEAYKLLKSEKLGAVIEKCTVINSSLNIAEVLENIMKYANLVTNSVVSTLMLLDEETGELVFSVPTGSASDKLTDIRIPPGKGIANLVAENVQHIIIPEAGKDPRFSGKIDEISGVKTKSILCVPLMAKSKLIGVLEVINKIEGVSFTEEDAVLLNFFASQAATAIENARCYGELKYKYEEEKKMQEKLAEAEKLWALGLMTSGIAHDFNNMLAIITGNIDLIEVEEDRDKILKRVQKIKKAAMDSAKIIKRLQKYAKTRDEKLLLQTIKFNDLVREAIEMSTPVWKDGPDAKGISIEIVFNTAEEELIIQGNDTDLRESIINLIFNSVDALPQGGKIHLATYTKNKSIYLDVSDNGIGMTEETKSRIFDPFFTTKGKSHSGLGMSMLYGTINRHDGAIDIKSTPGKGTTITIVLPEGEADVEKIGEGSDPAVKTEKKNILIIDDQPEVSMVLSEMLSNEGHQICSLNSSTDGIEAFKKGDYGILITDLGMPGASGWEIINTARQINPDVIIGIVTGWDISEEEIKQKGIDFLINKPFELNEIVQAVAKAVKSKSS